MNAIEAAVAPQREDSVAAAVELMTDHINVELTKLAAAGGDLNKLYERPSAHRHGREQYRKLVALRSFVYSITGHVNNMGGVQYPGAPEYRAADDSSIEKVLTRTAEEASLNFDAYVAKLTAKVGEVAAAEVRGSLWDHSILTITRADGSVERWKTQCIVNVSVLGKLFNQWPTRQMA